MNINPILTLDTERSLNFKKLKTINCRTESIYGRGRFGFYEKRLADELKKLAQTNIFFKDYDVKAYISVERASGALLSMECKPYPKNFKEKLKNFFSFGKKILLHKQYNCSDESSFFLAKYLRDIGESNLLYELLEK